MKRNKFIKFLHVGILLLVTGFSCTKLDTKVYDQISNFWQTPEQIAAGVGNVYSEMRNFGPGFWGYPSVYNLNEMSGDEIIVPNRGGDWGDDVVWEQIWKHTWGPNLQFVNDGWQFIYGGTAKVNFILEALTGIDPNLTNLDSLEAELKTLRAFHYYLAIDLFGNVPIVEKYDSELSTLGTRPRTEVFAFVEKELKNNLASLTPEVSARTYGRATQWFAQAILAKLYLNAQVFTGTPRWTECIEACDAILNSNQYALEANFFDNFKVDNEGSRENIFVIPFDRGAGLDVFAVQSWTLHYNSAATFGIQSGGFNGHCSTAEFYNIFDSHDLRRNMFLVGQQYVNQIPDLANLQYDRNGNLLIFDPVITKFKLEGPKVETGGARCAKWEFNNEGWGNMSNDFAMYRLADIILMKAEAQFMQGDVEGALVTINKKYPNVSIRSRAGMPDFPASEMTKDGLLNERAREFAWEGFRRNDMIRLGHFTDPRIPEKLASEEFRKLYPIPEIELNKNPYLVQNTGY